MANCDTEDKRRSASSMFLYVINPIADGIIGTTDRRQATGIYSGILPTGFYAACDFIANLIIFNFNAENRITNFNAENRIANFNAENRITNFVATVGT